MCPEIIFRNMFKWIQRNCNFPYEQMQDELWKSYDNFWRYLHATVEWWKLFTHTWGIRIFHRKVRYNLAVSCHETKWFDGAATRDYNESPTPSALCRCFIWFGGGGGCRRQTSKLKGVGKNRVIIKKWLPFPAYLNSVHWRGKCS